MIHTLSAYEEPRSKEGEFFVPALSQNLDRSSHGISAPHAQFTHEPVIVASHPACAASLF